MRGLRRIDNRRDCCPWQEEPSGDAVKTKTLCSWSVYGPIPFGEWRWQDGAPPLVWVDATPVMFRAGPTWAVKELWFKEVFKSRAVFALIPNQCSISIYELLCTSYLERGDVVEIDTKVIEDTVSFYGALKSFGEAKLPWTS